MVRRSIAFTCILVFAFISCALAISDPYNGIPVIDYEDGFHVELNAEIRSHMPFSRERVASLNALFKYLSLSTDVCGDTGSAILLINGEPQLTFVHEEMDGVVREWTDALSATVFTGEEKAGIFHADDSFSDPESLLDIGLRGDEYTILKELQNILNNMSALFPEVKAKEEKIRVKIGEFGTATKKITIAIPTEMAKQKDVFQDIVALNCTNVRLKSWIESVGFTGRQTLVQYLDEEENIIRTVYTGNVRYEDGRVHKMNLNWKSSKGEDYEHHEIILKAPAASGQDRDTLTLSMDLSQKTQEENNATVAYDYTRVRGQEKDVFQADIALNVVSDRNTRMDGHLILGRKHNKEKNRGWILNPNIEIDGKTGELVGHLEVSKTIGETSPESAVIHFTVCEGADIVQIPADIVETIALTDEQPRTEIESVINKAITMKLIVPLLSLPDEALSYFREGLDANQWNQIIKSIQ